MREPIGYDRLPTERANRASRALDRLSPLEIAVLMNREDRRAVAAVGRVTRATAAAVGLIVGALRRGGRLIFVGAGTGGRVGVLEAAECPPTFNTPPGLVQAVMAGGRASVFRSREGAEDDAQDAIRRLRARARPGDVVVGISASGVTPFVRAALREARARGCRTVLVACHPSRSLRGAAPAGRGAPPAPPARGAPPARTGARRGPSRRATGRRSPRSARGSFRAGSRSRPPRWPGARGPGRACRSHAYSAARAAPRPCVVAPAPPPSPGA